MTSNNNPGIFEDVEDIPAKPKRGLPPMPDQSEPTDRRLIGGVILIALGVIFLIQTVFGIDLGNWWAIFLIIPGLALLAQALVARSQLGYFPAELRGKIFGSVMLLFWGTIFLLELDPGKLWPLILIIIGVGMLMGWIGRDNNQKDKHA